MEPKLPPNDPDPVRPGFPEIPEPNPDEPGPDVFPQIDPGAPEPQRLQAGRFAALAVLSATLLFSWGCQSESQREAERRRAEQDVNSAAYKAGWGNGGELRRPLGSPSSAGSSSAS